MLEAILSCHPRTMRLRLSPKLKGLVPSHALRTVLSSHPRLLPPHV